MNKNIEGFDSSNFEKWCKNYFFNFQIWEQYINELSNKIKEADNLQSQAQAGVKFNYALNYPIDLYSFIGINPLATENDYLKISITNVTNKINELYEIVDFYFDDELDDENYQKWQDQNDYWVYKNYLIVLEKRKELTSQIEIENTKKLPEIELKTQKEQIGLLYELGVIGFLQDKYSNTLKGNNNQTAKLIAQILKLERSSIQPTVNALLNNNTDKNSLKESNKIKAIIDLLNSNQSI
jgi:hypothetical protein